MTPNNQMELLNFVFWGPPPNPTRLFKIHNRNYQDIIPVKTRFYHLQTLYTFLCILFSFHAKVKCHSQNVKISGFIWQHGLFMSDSLFRQHSFSLTLVYWVIPFQNPIALAGIVSLASPIPSLKAIHAPFGAGTSIYSMDYLIFYIFSFKKLNLELYLSNVCIVRQLLLSLNSYTCLLSTIFPLVLENSWPLYL